MPKHIIQKMMLTAITFAASQFALSSADLPPDSGAHFYADFRTMGHNKHVVDLKIGADSMDMSLWASTMEESLTLFSHECINCICKNYWYEDYDFRSYLTDLDVDPVRDHFLLFDEK
jgi:hypothetical protein